MEIKPELRAYLASKRWKWKPATASDIAVQTCPFCGRSKWKFWISAQRTVYRCFHCEAKGNLYKLKRELGDLKGVVSAASAAGLSAKKGKPVLMEHVQRWHEQLLASMRGMQYVRGRGFELETVKHFRLGLQKHKGRAWLTIPHIIDGQCWNVKFRTLPPSEKMFRRVSGKRSVLFNSDCLADHDSIVVTESETDAMSLWQAGVQNVVSLTCGADTFLPEWYDDLASKDRVTLCLDADDVGQPAAREIARRIGFDRCFNVLLPAHDANEVLVNHGPDELRRAVAREERFEVSGIVTLAEALLRCKRAEDVGHTGFLTPWDDFNRLIGQGWNLGDLVVLSAKYKVGKTTWALNQALHLARQDVPVLVYCLEMSIERLAQKVAAIVRRRPVDELRSVDYAMVRYRTRRLPLYYVEPDWGGSLKVEDVTNKIREAVKRYGIQFLVFDHLHFLCRSLQFLSNEIGQVTRAFKRLSEELRIVTCLIAQPKKIGDRVIRSDDLRDSSSIPMDADQIVLLHRKSIPAGLDDEEGKSEAEVMEPETLVRVDAARFQGGGDCRLWFDGAASTFCGMRDKPGRPSI